MISIGFTGSRTGITGAQFATLNQLMRAMQTSEGVTFHHGGCIGSDVSAHMIAWSLRWIIEVHCADAPPELRSPCAGAAFYHPPKPPLERNRDILDASSILLATPSGPETWRSGTWSTIRQARKRRLPVRIIWPDGRLEQER